MNRYALLAVIYASTCLLSCGDDRSGSAIDLDPDATDTQRGEDRDGSVNVDTAPERDVDDGAADVGEDDVADTAESDAADSGTDVEASPALCSQGCPCEVTCDEGVVTLWGTGGSWEGPCDEAPTCPMPRTFACDTGFCAAPPDDPCGAAHAAEAGDISALCWAGSCAPDAITAFLVDEDAAFFGDGPGRGLTHVLFDVAVTDEWIVLWWIDHGTLRVARAPRGDVRSAEAFETFEVAQNVATADHAVVDGRVRIVWSPDVLEGVLPVSVVDVSGAMDDLQPVVLAELPIVRVAATDSPYGLAVIVWGILVIPRVYWPDLPGRAYDRLLLESSRNDIWHFLRAAPHPAGLLLAQSAVGPVGTDRMIVLADLDAETRQVTLTESARHDPGSELVHNPDDGSWLLANVIGDPLSGTVVVHQLDPETMQVATSWTVEVDAGVGDLMAPDIAFDSGQPVVMWPDQRDAGEASETHDLYFARLNPDGSVATPGAGAPPFPDRRVYAFDGTGDARLVRFEALGDGEFIALAMVYGESDPTVGALYAIVGPFDCGLLIERP